MPALVQICIVLSTLALVVMAAATVLAGIAIRKSVECLDRTAAQIEDVVAEAKHVGGKVREISGTLQQAAESVRSAAKGFERVGGRAAAISGLVLDEVERPVRRMNAVMHGVRTGAGVLLDRWTHRLQRANSNGGNHDDE